MFQRFKKLFSSSVAEAESRNHEEAEQLKSWAEAQGYELQLRLRPGPGKIPVLGFSIDSQTEGKPWRLECGAPTRDFIKGEELLFRGELGVLDSVSVVVMSRPLKMQLEKRAYQIYTDSLQTTLDPKLPEEMRWIAMYQEAGWAGLPDAFWDRYAVMSGQREHAQSWLTPALVECLLQWPLGGPTAEIPFTLMMLRGKCYLRMQHSDRDAMTVKHATKIFKVACQSALENVAQNLQGR
ncbi:MAG: hypothetical protein KA045_00750 [Burkholderiaceae bacterium]|jgi:hypothetical protein|nr:hypothetical protein [Burkholderiaceae bacterium]